MAEEAIKETNSVSEQNNVENDSNHYIEAIKEMKANTVDKEAYLKLKEENKQLLNSLVNGEEIKGQEPEQKESIEELRLCRKCAKTKKCFNGSRTNRSIRS